jgi:hypothetical protein
MIGDREIGDATGDTMSCNKLLLTLQRLHERANNLVCLAHVSKLLRSWYHKLFCNNAADQYAFSNMGVLKSKQIVGQVEEYRN